MALPVRPSATPRDFSPNTLDTRGSSNTLSTPALDSLPRSVAIATSLHSTPTTSAPDASSTSIATSHQSNTIISSSAFDVPTSVARTTSSLTSTPNTRTFAASTASIAQATSRHSDTPTTASALGASSAHVAQTTSHRSDHSPASALVASSAHVARATSHQSDTPTSASASSENVAQAPSHQSNTHITTSALGSSSGSLTQVSSHQTESLTTSSHPTNSLTTSSAPEATLENVAQPTPTHNSNPTLPTTPRPKSTMCGPIIDFFSGSSPLSSPTTPTPTPPGVMTPKKTGSTEADWSQYVDSPKASPTSETFLFPDSPARSQFVASNVGKKRTHDGFDPLDKEAASFLDKEPAKGGRSNAQNKKRKLAKPAAPTSTRPTRTRKAPERYVDAGEPPQKKPVATPRKTAGAGSKIWAPKHVTESHMSRLLKVDVYHMLLAEEPWTSLSVAQKRELFSLIPRTTTNARLVREMEAGKAAASVRPLEFGINSKELRSDVAAFLQELGEGFLARRWQEAAEEAAVLRAAGAFDEWKEEEAEAWWGQK